MTPRRIMLVLQSADPPTSSGGMETFCVNLAGEFSARGYEVAAVLPETAVFDRLADQFSAAGAVVPRLTTDARRGRRSQLRRWARLVRLMYEWHPDVVHLHTGGATGGLGVIATARSVTPATVVITEHDVPAEAPRPGQRIRRYLVDRLSHAQIAVSRRNAAIRQARLGAVAQRFAAVLNGIPIASASPAAQAENRRRIRTALGIDREAVVAGSLVRLAEGKGLGDLIRALAIVRQTADVQLLLVGDGPLKSALEQLACELGVCDAVHFAGFQSEPAPYLDAMDVFALCVPAGSQSIALLEAMSRGLPAVITFGGPEEPVVPELTGLTAPPNDPAGLAPVLARLVTDVELRRRLGVAAAAHVRRNFSIARVADDLLEVYQTAPDGGAPLRLRAVEPAWAPAQEGTIP